jgi:hypothetical protein
VKLNRPWIWLLAIAVVLAIGFVLTLQYFESQGRSPLPVPKDEVTRRAAQRERIGEDFKLIGRYYKAYIAESKKPTSDGFWTYLNKQQDARAICFIIMEQQYGVQVPKGGVGIVGYERDADLNDTQVVIMADGTVNKSMPTPEFLAAMKKGKQ